MCFVHSAITVVCDSAWFITSCPGWCNVRKDKEELQIETHEWIRATRNHSTIPKSKT